MLFFHCSERGRKLLITGIDYITFFFTLSYLVCYGTNEKMEVVGEADEEMAGFF